MHDGHEPIGEVTSASHPKEIDSASAHVKTSGRSIHSGDDEKNELQEQISAPRLQRRLKARHLQMIAIGMLMLLRSIAALSRKVLCSLLLPRTPSFPTMPYP